MKGESFPDYMRKNPLQPIGLGNNAFLRAQIPAQLDFELGYEYFKHFYCPFEQGGITSFPSGDLYSTIEDLGCSLN